ncbi:glycine receptor subunit alpha-4-like [Palaemon carinicauda]|uniref:glycine receptor subunit alpha-4-like n=1 Tax=Palaemon carinicauda TaxID=392227 RepID=UPI0035B6284F
MPENPRDYDKMAPPKGGNEPTTVYFHVTVMSLDSIDESSMTYAADIFFAQSWKDWRLRLPDNMTHEYRLLPVNWLKDIWRPDSFFKNAKAVTFQEMTIPNHYIWLYQDNTILYMVKLTLVLSCAMNFQVYPHDTQECHMKIESLSHTTDDLVFMWDPEVPVEVERSIELPQLDLVKRYTGDCTQVYSTGNFTCLEIVFTFKRRLGYYLFHTYIPTCLIVIMSWISFWIRPEAVPARVTLGVTSLLTLSTQHANSQKSLPPVSYIKAIDVFMSSCTVFVFFSLMEYALVNVLLGDVPEEPEVRMRMRPRTLFQVASQQEAESPKKVTECLGSSRAGDYEASPARSNKSECSGQPPPPCLTAQRRSPAVERRPNGRKALCQTELDAITTITSPLASPANGMSPLEMTAVNPAAATAAATAASSSSSSSCPAHLSPSSHMTTSHMVNGPMFSGMHLGERKRRGTMQQQQQQQQHYHHHSSNSGAGCGGGGSSGSGMLQHHGAVQHSSMHNYGTIQNQQGMQLNLTFGLPPPPPPPHFGPGKATGKSRAQKQARLRERAILIDRVSRILFPVSFTVLNIIYWSVFVIEWF